MSRGHSLSRGQSGRRVLEKCKAKGKIEIIDVDKGKIDIVIIEEPGSPHQGSKGSKATRRNCYPDDVISIDDEEGDTDDTPKNLHCDVTTNRSRPAPSSSPISEESQSDECLMSAEKGASPFKRVNLMRMYNTASSSRNRFGLSSDCESSTSESDTSELDASQSSETESDSSDCELMEDPSGSIREQWERAAHRKKMSGKAQFGVEVQASASSSSGDPGFSSDEEMENKIDVASCSRKVPAGSSPLKRSNETENLSFSMPTAAEFSDFHLKTKANTSTAEPGTSDDTHYEEAGLEKKEHNSERCTGKAQSTDETIAHCKIAGFEGLTKMLRHPLCPPDVRRKFCFKGDGIFFLDNNMQVPVEISMGTDGIHLEYYINKALADYSARISSCTKDFASAVAELINLLAKIGRNSSSDSDHTTGEIHEDSGFQKKEHIGETCTHKALSPEEAFPDNKRVRSQCLEEPLGHHSCPSEGQCNINAKDAGACTSAATELSDSFLKTKADYVSETDPNTDIPHEESGFQKKERMSESPCFGKSSSCTSQPWDGIRNPSDNLGFQDKEEEVPGKVSSITKSQCISVVSPEIAASQNKEKLVFQEASFSKIQPSEKSMLSVDAEATHGKSACNSLPLHNDYICERERHKESDEYKRAAEEEWAARQKQLQIQSEEAQRLRRKRKSESLRLLDMERRQKERLEEIRESQKKDEETINLKEKFRAEVRKELDRMEHIYRDMASLLRSLGIPVKGGPYPLTREVNAAYKQALLRFHPDRASRTDIRQQVEAEEKFKLISRLKEKLQS